MVVVVAAAAVIVISFVLPGVVLLVVVSFPAGVRRRRVDAWVPETGRASVRVLRLDRSLVRSD